MTELAADLDAALQKPEPLLALRAILASRLAAGADREALLVELTDGMLAFHARGQNVQEELLADATDFLVGWCAPHMRL